MVYGDCRWKVYGLGLRRAFEQRCTYACMYVCLSVCLSVRTYVGMYVCMYVCMYVHMYICNTCIGMYNVYMFITYEK